MIPAGARAALRRRQEQRKAVAAAARRRQAQQEQPGHGWAWAWAMTNQKHRSFQIVLLGYYTVDSRDLYTDAMPARPIGFATEFD
jgi:hypothetical protein